MAQSSGFFNAQKTGATYDKIYDASDFSNYFSLFISDGVFINPADQLKVVAKSGRTVTVKAGWAFIEGYWFHLDADLDITLGPNTTSSGFFDTICCTLNKTNRQITIEKKENVSSTLPVNNGIIHELVLATIQVNAGATEITNARISDLRPSSKYCGFVSSPVTQIDTSNLFLQYDTAFNEWFNDLKGKLGDDPATQLQQQITQLRGVVNANKEELVPVEFLTFDNMSSVIRTGNLFGGTINTMHGIKVGNIITLTYQISNISRGGGDATVFTLRDQKYFPVHYGIFPMYVGKAECAAYTGIFTDGRVTMSIIGGSNISSSNRTLVAGTITYATWGA